MRGRDDGTTRWQGYRYAWAVAFGTTCAVGIVIATLTLSTATIFGLFSAVALTFGSSFWSWTTVSALPQRLAVSAAFWSGAVAVSTHGLTTAFGPWSLMWLLALGLGTPGGVSWVRERWVERRPFDDPEARGLLDPTRVPLAGLDLHLLSSADLERVWHLSGALLVGGPGSRELAHLARLRGACLDEMERRDPVRLRRWLAVDAT